MAEPILLGWEHGSAFEGESLRHLHHDLPHLLPFIQPLERRTDLLEGKHAIDDRPQRAARQQPHDLAVFSVVPHRRTQNAPVIPEESPEVDRNLGAGRGAAAYQSAAATDTPPPIPQMSAVSPRSSWARVTTMRHAVSVTRENAAASAQLSGGVTVGMMATFCSGTTIASHSVPGTCSPSRR